jgi:chromate transport protein ChrA
MPSEVRQSENRHDEAGSEKETRTAGFGQTVLEPFLVFLRLGLTSFGGPIAHLGYFRQEFVERRNWLTEQTFADLLALCNFLPGPTSSQVSYSIGMTRGGIPGAISAWSAFTLPSAIIMLLVAYGIHWVSGEQGASWLHGLKVVAVAVVAQAVWSMATKLCTDRTRISFAFVAAVIILLTNSSSVQNRLRASAAAQSLLAGANATVVGVLLAALSAYLDKRNRFSEELGACPHPVCWFADLEDNSVDPRRDWRGIGGNFL